MEPPSSSSITVIDECGQLIPAFALQSAVHAALAAHGHAESAATVLLTQDREIRELNLKFRNVDDATDVLSFPSGDEDELGDIAIAVPYAQRQALARGVTLTEELTFLAIHGALHLVGFDDQSEPERAQMVDEMNRIAEQIGLPPDREWASILHGEES